MPALGMQTVGVISSITCGQAFQNAFENALNAVSGPIPVTYFDRVGYDPSLLTDAVTSFNSDSGIGLIVTFGGMIAYRAATSGAKDFISLTATDPTSAPPCRGGVSLETFIYNTPAPTPVTFTAGSQFVSPLSGLRAKDAISFARGTGGTMPSGVTEDMRYTVRTVDSPNNRFTFTSDGSTDVTPTTAGTNVNLYCLSINSRMSLIMNRLGVDASDISLLYHAGSRAAPLELANWRGIRQTLPGVGKPGAAVPINVRKEFSGALSSLTTKAVIISADPFFQENKEALIEAANNEPIFVCYPLMEYRNNNGNHKPAAGRTLLYGPRLQAAISQMGTLAGNVLANVPATPQAFSKADYFRPIFL